jgi:prophage regulatory protein
MTSEEKLRRLPERLLSVGKNRVLSLPETLLKIGKSKTAWYAEIAAGRAPKPIKVGPRSSRWIEAELDAYLDARVQERDATTGRPGAA